MMAENMFKIFLINKINLKRNNGTLPKKSKRTENNFRRKN